MDARQKKAGVSLASPNYSDTIANICQNCDGFDADFVCPCTFPPAYVCFDCYEKHQRKRSESQHAAFPGELYPLICEKRNYVQMQPRLLNAIAFKQWLQRSLACLDTCEDRINSSIAHVKSAVSEWESNLKSTFCRIKREVLDYAAELECLLDSSITASDPSQLSAVEHVDVSLLVALISVSTHEVHLRSILGSVVEIQRLTPAQLSLESDCYSPQRPTLPVISQNAVSLFSVPSLNSHSFLVSNAVLEVDNNSCWVFVSNDCLFLCGGKHTGRSTALVSIPKKFRTKLADMTENRFLHCLVHCDGEIFVFGGAGKGEKSAEKYKQSACCWFRLPDMQFPRVGSSASLHSRTVYLFGGARSESIERFSIESAEFTVISSVLPFKSWTVSLATAHEVFILSKDRCVVFDLTSTCVTKFDPIPVANWWSPTPAVLHNGVFFFLQGKSIHTFTVSTRTYALQKLTIRL